MSSDVNHYNITSYEDDIEFDYGPEWRAYTREERMARSRVGAPIHMTEPIQVYSYVGAYGNTHRLAKLQALILKRSASGLLGKGLKLLRERCRELSLDPDRDTVCETAARALRKLINSSHRMEVRIDAALYYALSRHNHQTRYRITQEGGPNYVAMLMRFLASRGLYLSIPPSRDIMNHLRRASATLGISPIVVRYASQLAAAMTHGLPRSRAACALWLIGSVVDGVRQLDVAKAVGVTTNSLRMTCRRNKVSLKIIYRNTTWFRYPAPPPTVIPYISRDCVSDISVSDCSVVIEAKCIPFILENKK